MNKIFTKQWFRVFTLMTLLTATSLVANAGYYLRSSCNWDEDVAMTENSDGTWTVTQQMTDNTEFLIINKYDGNEDYWKYTPDQAGDFGTATSLPWDFRLVKDGQKNMTIAHAANVLFTYTPSSNTLNVKEIIEPKPVTYTIAAGEGAVTINPTEASAGETVTITVTPGEGFYAENQDITVEAWGDPGIAHAPRRAENPDAPGIKFELEVNGDALATNTSPGTYTFVMPDYPLEAKVTVNFQECVTLTAEMFNDIANQDWTGEAIEPEVTANDNEVTFDITGYNNNTDPGTATVTVTGNGKYKGTVELEFTIAKVAHTITINQPDNGTVAVGDNLTTAIEGTVISLTATATDPEVYELGSFTVTDANGTPVTVNTDGTFTMPNFDVTVTATFVKIHKLYLSGSFNDWGNAEGGNYPFTKNADGSWTLTKQLTKMVEFKLSTEENDVWLGPESYDHDYDFVREDVEGDGLAKTLTTNTSAKNFYLPVAGEWTFTVNAERTQLTVTGVWAYTITIESTGCTVTTDPENEASATTTVTVNVIADENTSGTVEVLDADNNPIEYDATSHTFVMPYSNVTIKATYTVMTFSITLPENDKVTLGTDQDDVTAVPVGTQVVITPEFKGEYGADFVVTGLDFDDDAALNFEQDENGNFTFTMPARDITVNPILEAILHGVVFDAKNQWATYFGNYNLVTPDGVDAYVVDHISDGALEITKVDNIPQGVGVLLYSENTLSNLTTPLYQDATDAYESILEGDVNDKEIAQGDYVLFNNTFVRSSAGTLTAHRCYLPASVATAAGAPRRLMINLPNTGIVTGIEGISADDITGVKYVNLAGMTSEKPFSGVNIVVITLTDGTTQTVKMMK